MTLRVIYTSDIPDLNGSVPNHQEVFTVVDADGNWEVEAPIANGFFAAAIGQYTEDLQTVIDACTNTGSWSCGTISFVNLNGNFYANIVGADLPDLGVPPEPTPEPEPEPEPGPEPEPEAEASTPESKPEQPKTAIPFSIPLTKIQTKASEINVPTAETDTSTLLVTEPDQVAQQQSVPKQTSPVHTVTTSLLAPQPPNPARIGLGALLLLLGAAAAAINRVLRRRSR